MKMSNLIGFGIVLLFFAPIPASGQQSRPAPAPDGVVDSSFHIVAHPETQHLSVYYITHGILSIKDESGNKIFSLPLDKNNHRAVVSTSSWDAGTYTYRFQAFGTDNKKSGKLIIIKQ